MTTNTFFALGVLAGLMAAVWALSRKSRREKHYDEMQLQIRANGYKLGFFTILALLVVLMLLSEEGLFSLVSPSLALFAALLIGVVTFAVYCIRHGAFLSVGDKGKSYLAVLALVTLSNGGVALNRLLGGRMLENGLVTLDFGAPALVFAGFVIILAVLAAQIARSGKEAEE